MKEAVLWPVDSQIVIATTGDKFSVGQTEVRTIVGKSDDNRTLLLDKPLQFEHLSVKRTVGLNSNNKSLEIFVEAEVGLLTRNVVFRGNEDTSWLAFGQPACQSTFDPGEFVVQKCFSGLYGAEKGSAEFGATIIVRY